MEQKATAMAASFPETKERRRQEARLPDAWKPRMREQDILIQRLKGFRSPREDLLVCAFPSSVPENADIPMQNQKRRRWQSNPRGAG